MKLGHARDCQWNRYRTIIIDLVSRPLFGATRYDSTQSPCTRYSLLEIHVSLVSDLGPRVSTLNCRSIAPHKLSPAEYKPDWQFTRAVYF
ncbi:MAG: hypothetical protein ACI9BW_004699 [Gammaproteobacteria bacterium]|jgi:hypothetical protein